MQNWNVNKLTCSRESGSDAESPNQRRGGGWNVGNRVEMGPVLPNLEGDESKNYHENHMEEHRSLL